MDFIYNTLNDKQKEAVTSTEGYVRVIAGAGSGKTKALTYRYAYLIKELGISSQNILCITFTNKAAKEMKNRIKMLLGGEYDTSFVATLHSFCTRILREDISHLFYPENFIVLDPSDQKKILEEIYDEMDIKLDTATFRFILEKIMYYKNLLTYMDHILKPTENIALLVPKNMEEEIIIKYIQKQKKYFGLDFFDLINFVIYLFKNYPQILLKWQQRIHYVMVDEFQDITNKEFKLIKSLTEINQNFFVVGDPDQNIYEWRGASMEVLLDFDKKVSPVKTIILNENYRSTPEILNASNTLIQKNVQRIEKNLFTQAPNGEKITYYHAKNNYDEISYITKEIKKFIEKGYSNSDIAILYRSAYVSRFIEQGLLKEDIAYIIYGGVGFYDRKEIKDVLSYLRLVCYGDDLALLRVINMPRRKFGKVKLGQLRNLAETDKTSLYEALKNHKNLFSSEMSEFVDVIENARNKMDKIAVSELLQDILIESKYELYVRESGDVDRLDNISELQRSIMQLEVEYAEPMPMHVYLQDISLHSERESEAYDTVKIMTMHTSKGLEFPIVFIAGMNEGIFPSARALETRKEKATEEERRLCYVAMTRAKTHLYMTDSEGLGFRGHSKTPSRFLFDIDGEYMTILGKISDQLIEETKIQASHSVSVPVKRYEVGIQVLHKVFGEGIIEAADEKTRSYTIRFMHGTKPISFDYAGLAEVF